jgi:hypothetical protein
VSDTNNKNAKRAKNLKQVRQNKKAKFTINNKKVNKKPIKIEYETEKTSSSKFSKKQKVK